MVEKEISLRDIIEIIWNGKFVLSIVLLIALVCSAIFTFAIQSPIYETKSILRLGKLDNSLDLKGYIETATSDVMIKSIIDNLGVSDEHPIENIRNSIRVQTDSGSSVLTITVTGSDPSLAASIANFLAFELGARIEIRERSQDIIVSKQKVEEIKRQLSVTEQSVLEAEKQLANTPEKIMVKQSLADDPFLQSVAKDATSLDAIQLGNFLMETETINPLFIKLTETISSGNLELVKLETELVEYEKLIETNQELIDELENVNKAQYLNTTNIERIFGLANTVFIHSAIEPSIPIGPNKGMNMIIGGFVGILLGVVLIFVRHYWHAGESKSLSA